MTDTAVQLLPPGEGPSRGPFAKALQDRQGEALAFLEEPPADRDGWARRMAIATDIACPCPAAVLDSLHETQVRLQAGPRARANIEALAGERVLVVATGQQPGLFGGPMLTMHKIAGAIHLANALDGVDGIRVVPLYWSATEDHDLDEANRATVLDRSGTPKVLQIEARNDGRSIGHRAFDDATLDAVFEALAAALPDTERGREALALARRTPDDDFAYWSLRCVTRLFGDSGLIIADPLAFQASAAESYDELLVHSRMIDDQMRAAGAELTLLGLPAPLSFEEGTAPLFVRETVGGPRLRVHIDPQGQVTLRGTPSGDLAALRARVRAEPRLASGNVAGRVFVQNALFPVLAYMAGPTEIAYQAQVKRAHEPVKAHFPLALPRPQATWVDVKTTRRAEHFGYTLASLLRDTPGTPAASDTTDVVQAVETHLGDWPEDVLDALARKGAGPDALARALERLTATWQKAAPRVRAGFAADAGRGPAQWARLQDVLRPRNRPQDRVLSPLSLVARHGVSAIRAGLAKLDPLAAGHYLVHVENLNA